MSNNLISMIPTPCAHAGLAMPSSARFEREVGRAGGNAAQGAKVDLSAKAAFTATRTPGTQVWSPPT